VAWYSFNGSGEREDGITGFELVTGLSALICLTGEVGFDSADSNINWQEFEHLIYYRGWPAAAGMGED